MLHSHILCCCIHRLTLIAGAVFRALVGVRHDYRVEAWNLFGRSEDSPASAPPAEMDRLGNTCINAWASWGSASGLNRGGYFGEAMRCLWWLIATLSSFVGFILKWMSPIFGIITALMRIRRVSQPSSSPRDFSLLPSQSSVHPLKEFHPNIPFPAVPHVAECALLEERCS